MLCGPGKVQETLACPNHQIPLTQDMCIEACVCSAILHGSETWEPNCCPPCRNDCAMIRWICGIKDRDLIHSASLLLKFGIQDITSVRRCRRISWYGYVPRATSCFKSITNFPLPSTKMKGWPCKTWSECVKTDIYKCGLASIKPLDIYAWRAGVRHSLVLPTPLNGHGQHLDLKWIWLNGWIA